MTSVEIANAALIHVGARTILSLDDANKEAETVKIVFSRARRVVLRSHPWNCATARATLASVATPPAFEYAYQFELPTDCLRVLRIGEGSGERADYVIEGRKVLSEEAILYLRYIKDEENTAVLDELFCDALAAYIAFEIGYSLTQSDTVKQAMFTVYEDKLKRARFVDAVEEPAQLASFGDSVDRSRLEPHRGMVRDPGT